MSVTFERDEDRPHVGHLRLSVGDLNLLSVEAMADLADAAGRVPDDVAVLTVAADPLEETEGLTAGLDLSEAREFDAHEGLAMFEVLYGAIEAVRDVDAVTVCGCGAYTFGAGLELAMACDFRIAPADASLGLPEVDVGLPTVIHGGLLLRLVGETAAKELIYTGEPVSGERAAALGLVTDAVPEAEYADAVRERVDQLAGKSPLVLGRQKQVFRLWRSVGLERGMQASLWPGALSFGTHDQQEAMAAFFEDRDPSFEGQ
jgi:enoyl-CoA hydratase